MHMLKYSGGSNISGYAIITDPDALHGVVDEGETVSCCHCQFTWIVKPGSGTRRGWCYLCQKPVCGKEGCLSGCVPLEKRIELVEAKARFHYLVDEARQEARREVERQIEQQIETSFRAGP